MIQPTVDELIATLIRSDLPTIIVEGDDDMTVYRWIEEKIGPYKGNILPCYGRPNLLTIYDRRNEFSNLKTAFVADQDMWLFTSIPPEYVGIIWTKGYSIENDLYADSNIESLFEVHEVAEYKQVLSTMITWFSFEVEEYRNGRDYVVNCHPNQIIEDTTKQISNAFIAQRGYTPPTQATIDEINKDYALKIRGKTLFDLLTLYLNAPNRAVKHRRTAIYEICCKIKADHIYLNRLLSEINVSLGIS